MSKTVRGQNGVVATGHGLASAAALEILRAGGNAADAAAAAALVLAVVSPHAVSLGGDLFALVYDPAAGAVSGLNASGRSPRAATAARFAGGIPANGPLAATVPALLRGVGDLVARHGTRDLAGLIEPALRFAQDGCPVSRPLAAASSERAALLAQDAAARALFLPRRRAARRERDSAPARSREDSARGGKGRRRCLLSRRHRARSRRRQRAQRRALHGSGFRRA